MSSSFRSSLFSLFFFSLILFKSLLSANDFGVPQKSQKVKLCQQEFSWIAPTQAGQAWVADTEVLETSKHLIIALLNDEASRSQIQKAKSLPQVKAVLQEHFPKVEDDIVSLSKEILKDIAEIEDQMHFHQAGLQSLTQKLSRLQAEQESSASTAASEKIYALIGNQLNDLQKSLAESKQIDLRLEKLRGLLLYSSILNQLQNNILFLSKNKISNVSESNTGSSILKKISVPKFLSKTEDTLKFETAMQESHLENQKMWEQSSIDEIEQRFLKLGSELAQFLNVLETLNKKNIYSDFSPSNPKALSAFIKELKKSNIDTFSNDSSAANSSAQNNSLSLNSPAVAASTLASIDSSEVLGTTKVQTATGAPNMPAAVSLAEILKPQSGNSNVLSVNDPKKDDDLSAKSSIITPQVIIDRSEPSLRSDGKDLDASQARQVFGNAELQFLQSIAKGTIIKVVKYHKGQSAEVKEIAIAEFDSFETKDNVNYTAYVRVGKLKRKWTVNPYQIFLLDAKTDNYSVGDYLEANPKNEMIVGINTIRNTYLLESKSIKSSFLRKQMIFSLPIYITELMYRNDWMSPLLIENAKQLLNSPMALHTYSLLQSHGVDLSLVSQNYFVHASALSMFTLVGAYHLLQPVRSSYRVQADRW